MALTDDPQVRHNGTVIEVDHPTAGRFPMMALPVNFSKTPARYERAAPLLGQDTRDVLAEFGFLQQEIEQLFSDGAACGLGMPVQAPATAISGRDGTHS